MSILYLAQLIYSHTVYLICFYCCSFSQHSHKCTLSVLQAKNYLHASTYTLLPTLQYATVYFTMKPVLRRHHTWYDIECISSTCICTWYRFHNCTTKTPNRLLREVQYMRHSLHQPYFSLVLKMEATCQRWNWYSGSLGSYWWAKHWDNREGIMFKTKHIGVCRVGCVLQINTCIYKYIQVIYQGTGLNEK